MSKWLPCNLPHIKNNNKRKRKKERKASHTPTYPKAVFKVKERKSEAFQKETYLLVWAPTPSWGLSRDGGWWEGKARGLAWFNKTARKQKGWMKMPLKISPLPLFSFFFSFSLSPACLALRIVHHVREEEKGCHKRDKNQGHSHSNLILSLHKSKSAFHIKRVCLKDFRSYSQSSNWQPRQNNQRISLLIMLFSNPSGCWCS